MKCCRKTFRFNYAMNILPNSRAREITNLALDLLDAIKKTQGISIEVDSETGVQFVGQLGAVGASADMPRDISAPYLECELSGMLDSPGN